MLSFIIQARLGSTRLPNKILLPFYQEKCILELLIEKLKNIKDTNIIIATSSSSINDPIDTLAKKNGVKCFRGSEDDVLDRFINTAIDNNVQKIIRICSDNPFLEINAIKQLVETALNGGKDYEYISFNVNGTPSIKTHYGFWTEYVTLEALQKVQSLTSDKIFHEHVTNYIYTNPNLFEIKWIDVNPILQKYKNIRLTIDTIEDFNNVKKIYSDICSTIEYPTIEDIIAYLESHKELFKIMEDQIIKNSK